MKASIDFFKKFSLRNLLTRKKEVSAQSAEFFTLDTILGKTTVLKHVNSTKENPLVLVAAATKSIIDVNADNRNHTGKSLIHLVESDLASRMTKLDSNDFSSVMRVTFARKYFSLLNSAVSENEIDPNLLTVTIVGRLVDVALLGTSSERIQEHMRLYGPLLSTARLQDCFYSLYEPEVEACSSMLVAVASKDKALKHHVKGVPKLAKSYLLDKLELNSKVRCIVAWSDSTYSGFKPLPDDHRVDCETLVAARRRFFPEIEEVGRSFVAEVISQRRQLYDQRLDDRETRYLGGAFFVATCLLDWYISVL